MENFVNRINEVMNSTNHSIRKECLTVDRIIFNPPATIVFWRDGSKTVVKTMEGTEFNGYFGFCAALAKRIYGTNAVNTFVRRYGWDENSTAKKEEKPAAVTYYNRCADCYYKYKDSYNSPCYNCDGHNRFEPKNSCPDCAYEELDITKPPCNNCRGYEHFVPKDCYEDASKEPEPESSNDPVYYPASGDSFSCGYTCDECEYCDVDYNGYPCDKCNNGSQFVPKDEKPDEIAGKCCTVDTACCDCHFCGLPDDFYPCSECRLHQLFTPKEADDHVCSSCRREMCVVRREYPPEEEGNK